MLSSSDGPIGPNIMVKMSKYIQRKGSNWLKGKFIYKAVERGKSLLNGTSVVTRHSEPKSRFLILYRL